MAAVSGRRLSFQGVVIAGNDQSTGVWPSRELDADAQCRHAVEAFQSNGFFMLVDDRQVEDLDEEIGVTGQTCVSFVKLVPLVGG